MIRIALTTDTATCFALRHDVFVVEQGYSAEGEVDALDAESHHLLAWDADTPVATARIFMDGSIARIGRVCVVRARRGAGLGAELIGATLAHARELDATRAELGAQIHATSFYAALGFAPFGPLYNDEGEPHQMMACDL